MMKFRVTLLGYVIEKNFQVVDKKDEHFNKLKCQYFADIDQTDVVAIAAAIQSRLMDDIEFTLGFTKYSDNAFWITCEETLYPHVNIYQKDGDGGYVLCISEYESCIGLPDFDGFKIETYEDILKEKLRGIEELKSELQTNEKLS